MRLGDRAARSRQGFPVPLLLPLLAALLLVRGAAGRPPLQHGPPSLGGAPAPGAGPPLVAASAVVADRPLRGGSPLRTYTLRVQLPQPVSRAAAFPTANGDVLLAGGFFGDTRAAGNALELVEAGADRVVQVGVLRQPVAEAAAGVIGGTDLAFGGAGGALSLGDGSVTAAVQRLAPSRRPRSPASATVGLLPAGGLAGAGAAQFGHEVVLAGGYRGSSSEGAVLATTDGRRFRTIGSLAVAVRYPAVAALGRAVYVIGGEAVEEGVAEPVDDVQVFTPGRRQARVIGHLPQAVSGASAWVSDGRLYVAGGDTSLQLDGFGRDTSDAVWVYLPGRQEFGLAGYLSEPVSHAAAVAVPGGELVIGGEYQGTPVSTVQLVRP